MIISLLIKNFKSVELEHINFLAGITEYTPKNNSDTNLIVSALESCLCLTSYVQEEADPKPYSISIEINISALPEIKQLLASQLIDTGDVIILRKTANSQAERYFIDDQLVSPNTIKKIADILITFDLTFEEFIDLANHTRIVDLYGNLLEACTNADKLQSRIQQTAEKLDINNAQKSIDQEIAYLQKAIHDCTNSEVKPNEEQYLLNEMDGLQQTIAQQRSLQKVSQLFERLDATSLLSELEALLSKEKNLAQPLQYLEEALNNLNLCQKFVDSRLQSANLEHKIFEIEERLFELKTLARKYEVETSNLYHFLQSSNSALNSLEKQKLELILAQEELTLLQAEYHYHNTDLNSNRREAAAKIANDVNSLLEKFITPTVQLEVSIAKEQIYDAQNIKFYATANRVKLPIDQLGDMAPQVLLAFKQSLARSSKTPIILWRTLKDIPLELKDCESKFLNEITKSKQVLKLCSN